MKADTVDLAAVFGNQVRYVVPLYQRPYVWNRDDQWDPLWQDIQAVAERQLDDTTANDAIPHFLGAVVLEQTLGQSGRVSTRMVIDGQQRLTTLQLLLAATRSLAGEFGDEDARETVSQLLVNPDVLVRHDGYRFKVLPTERDRAAFMDTMRDTMDALTGSHRMHEAYQFFRDAIREWATDGADPSVVAKRMDALVNVLWQRLVLVTIDLDPGDNAQVIFETLNARGTPLLAGDLIKNHLFQLATMQGADVADLYQRYWSTLDTDWWREVVARGRLLRPRLDTFLTYWLAMRTGAEVVSHDLFPAFKRHVASSGLTAADTLADLQRYAIVFESLEQEPVTSALGRFLYRLDIMEVTTAFPALLWLLGPDGIVDTEERDDALAAIESWLVRRMLVRATTKNYNAVFIALLNAVRLASASRPPSGGDVVGFLEGLSGESQYWPRAADVVTALTSMPIYRVLPRARLRMVLEALESASHTGLAEKVTLPPALTIEHVMPQQWGTHWPLADDADPIVARPRRDAAVQTIGNLTLVTNRLNPRMSNGPWPDKRKALQQYSLLLIAADIRNADQWDETAIAARGERLAALAVSTWSRPNDDGASSSAAPLIATAQTAPAATTAERPTADASPFAASLAIADVSGVGAELRRIIAVSQELGLHPRGDKYSVMVTPPGDRRVMLFTVWPQPELGGSFRIWKSASAFTRWLPEVTLEAAQGILGATEGPGVLRGVDVERFLDTVRSLVLAPTLGATDAAVVDDGLPAGVQEVIDLRAGPAIGPLARLFAERALAHEGVAIRPPTGSGRWYYQVRHPKFSQIVAYVSPREDELHIDYRLPQTSETYGVAEARDNFYGISFKVRQPQDLDMAERLLQDALERER